MWRRRNVPGARPLAIAAFFGVFWIVSFILERAAVESSAKIFWFAFQGVWQLPLATAIFCFVLEYAGLGRWLTRRNLLLLSIPPLLVLAIILTNSSHHLMWQSFQVDETVRTVRGSAYWITIGYAFALALIGLVVFARLFIRSPRHRWPVVLMITGQVVNRTLVVLDSLELGFPEPGDPILIMFVLAFFMYAVALFRFHIFDPVPLARVAVLDQMTEGMLVIDLQERVADSNPVAARILGKRAADLKGRALGEVLPIMRAASQTRRQSLNGR